MLMVDVFDDRLVKTVELEVERFMASTELPRDLRLENLETQVKHIRYCASSNLHVLETTYRCATERVYAAEHKVPRTWWDHLKSSKFPAWFTKRYPVKYDTIKVDVRACYTNISLPDKMPVLTYTWLENGLDRSYRM